MEDAAIAGELAVAFALLLHLQECLKFAGVATAIHMSICW
jgi:hypothetical protein